MVNVFTLVVVFFNVWWVVFFMTLPFGAAAPEQAEKGHSTGAPAKTHLGKKAAVTTLIALVVTAAFFYFTSGYLIPPEAM